MTIQVGGGGGGGTVTLAPNIGELESRPASNEAMKSIDGIDVSGGVLQSVLSLSGKYVIDYIKLGAVLTSENLKLKLTIDGISIYNEDWTPSNSNVIIAGFVTTLSNNAPMRFLVKESLLLELATVTDTDIDLDYIITPIT